MRKIAVLTGTRADYGILKPVMKAIKDNRELGLKIIVTGTHLMEKFGYTLNDILKDGFGGEIVAATNELGGIRNALKEANPDIALVLGDRSETLVGAIAAAYMNIPVAHIHGGDITEGGLDESARHAITKFAHIHFPATETSCRRILKMGEEPWRIHVVGAPCMDTILHTKLMEKEEVEKALDINLSEPVVIVIQHSVSTENDKAGPQLNETLEAIKELQCQTVFIYPNIDAGTRIRFGKIDQFKKLPFIRVHESLPQQLFLSLMKYASAMVGNSSSGIIESPAFRLPVVNIGTRQKGRERANNIIDVDYNKDEIVAAIKKAMSPEFRESLKDCTSPYGDGRTSEKIVDVLKKVEINQKLMQKRWVDNDV